MTGTGRRAIAGLGGGAIASLVFWLTESLPTTVDLVRMPGVAALVILLFGVLSILAAAIGSRVLSGVVAVLFLAAAVLQLVQLQGGGLLGGNASTMSLLGAFGIGIGAVAISELRPVAMSADRDQVRLERPIPLERPMEAPDDRSGQLAAASRRRGLHAERHHDLGGHPRLLRHWTGAHGLRAVLELRPSGGCLGRGEYRRRLEHQPRVAAHRHPDRRGLRRACIARHRSRLPDGLRGEGRSADPLAAIDPSQRPGTRIWMYTNFDCNLACDYCCVRSSPQTARRALGRETVARLASEAVVAGVRELILTGGEPFLLPDLDEVVEACSRVLPTTLLTNAMLFRGRRLELLRRMSRDELTLQVSLDSATPELHDSHRGARSWSRAVEGIRIAHDEGFRVKVAATLEADRRHDLDPFRDFLDTLGIDRDDQVIRALPHRGVAESGVELTVESLIPEVTITSDGVYWHPVAADHDDQLVTRTIFPLQDAIDEVLHRFTEHRRRANEAASWFPCA